MGTRGNIVYKWRGRYYIYYNHYDSYPSGLGKRLVIDVPSNPDQYQQWLQCQRDTYSDLAKKLEAVFTVVSMNNSAGDNNHDEPEDHGLQKWPDFFPPDNDLFIEWIYVIDLDREIFGIQGVCFYHLADIPPNFEDLMEEAQDYWLGNVGKDEIHKSITTNDLPPTPLTCNSTPAFLQMKPMTVSSKQHSSLNRMPAFVVCKRLYEVFTDIYDQKIRHAQDCDAEFPFRELVFALMCFASCSPGWVRLISVSNFSHQESSSCWKIINTVREFGYGVIVDHDSRDPKEFISRFLRGYHLQGVEPGSSPKATSYWHSGALVYLERDITSRDRFHNAIVSAVEKGKADGHTHFDAIVISLKHFILLRFTNGNLQHTKRLDLGIYPVPAKYPGLKRDYEDSEEEEGPEKSGTDEGEPGRDLSGFETTTGNKDGGCQDASGIDDPSDDCDWACDEPVPAFEILAHFFDATQKRPLKPSAIYNEGVFPNELYQIILSHVDRDTNITCRKVSRNFRQFALETFSLDNGWKLVHRPGKGPEYFHDTMGFMGPFKPEEHIEYERPWETGSDSMQVAVFGSSDGSASIETGLFLSTPPLDRVSDPDHHGVRPVRGGPVSDVAEL
ncbi:hypothetical protein F5Y03DRAFT_355827 [Xylaria venustula]|nr:hypothetical protein F5Y03DRAFT_355827 [Xylaria venustula]